MIGKPSEPHLSSHVVERQGVGEGLAGGLDGEVVLVVADGESGKVEGGEQLLTCTRPNLGNLPLSIGCAETNPPLVGISTSKLGDVVRRSSLAVASTPGSFKIQLLRDCLIPDHKESWDRGIGQISNQTGSVIQRWQSDIIFGMQSDVIEEAAFDKTTV